MVLFEQGFEYFTFPAEGHLPGPALLHLSPAVRPIDEPAELAGPEFPCRTLSLQLRRTVHGRPAGFSPGIAVESRFQEVDLPLHIARNDSPALLVPMDCAQGDSQEMAEFFLSFFQLLPAACEFLAVHGTLSRFYLVLLRDSSRSLLSGPPGSRKFRAEFIPRAPLAF